jgi:hypothetical protein
MQPEKRAAAVLRSCARWCQTDRVSVVDLDVDLPEARERTLLLQRIRALPRADQAALILLVAALALVAASITLPWASTTTNFRNGPRQPDSFTDARSWAQGACYLIWAVIVAAGATAVFDRVRRMVWFGVAIGAFGGLVLLMTPVLHMPRLMAPNLPLHHPAEVTYRGAGWFCVVAALIAALVGLLVVVRGRILPPRSRTVPAAMMLLAYLLTLSAQRLTWIRFNTSPRTAVEVGMTVRAGPAVAFGTWQAMYAVAWTVALAIAGAMLFARRGRPALAATAGAALVTLGPIVGSPLRQPVPFFNAAFFPNELTWQRAVGEYVIVSAVILFGAAILGSIGRSIWPATWSARATAALVTVAAGLGTAAQLLPWYYAPGSRHGIPITPSIYLQTPLLAYTLTWLVALTGLAGAAYADGTARRLLLGLGTAGVAGLTMVLLPVLRHLGLLVPSPLPGTVETGSTGVGLPLAVAAMVALVVAVTVAWLPELRRLRKQSIPVIAVALLGLGLAIAGQMWHWAVVYFGFTTGGPINFGGPHSLVYPLAMPPGATLPLILAWLIVTGAGASALLTTGRLRLHMLDLAIVGVIAQAALTALFDSRLTDPATELALLGDGPFTTRMTYAAGTWITYGAVAVFAVWLLIIRGRRTAKESPLAQPPVAPEDDRHAAYRRPLS